MTTRLTNLEGLGGRERGEGKLVNAKDCQPGDFVDDKSKWIGWRDGVERFFNVKGKGVGDMLTESRKRQDPIDPYLDLDEIAKGTEVKGEWSSMISTYLMHKFTGTANIIANGGREGQCVRSLEES